MTNNQTNQNQLINDLVRNGKQGRTWGELALIYNIKAHGSPEQRRKAANDIWRQFLKAESQPQMATELPREAPEVYKPKRLFYDIETSYNLVKSWRIGYNININMNDIIQERAIITVAYKWAGEEEVTVLSWDNGCDKKLIEQFMPVLAEADELVGHNVDRYDTKFVTTRALKHGIKALPKYQSTDTLKLAKRHFMFNSNKLDYIAQFLEIGHKTKHRGLDMWDDIILRNDKKALEEMIEYNIQDVYLTEEVYNKLMEYSIPKINHQVLTGEMKGKCGCPECGSKKATLVKTYATGAGAKSRLMNCDSCETNYTLSESKYKKEYGEKNK